MKHTESDNLPGGIVAINKPCGISSHDVVNRVRRLYNTTRVGHAGTLDPLASGVLVVLVGRAAKACEYISSDAKTYRATLRLGVTTDTEDICGKVLDSTDVIPSETQVKDTCKKFVGDILQTPPMYSALKVNGQKLYELARRGESVERKARPISIFSIHCEPTDDPTDYIIFVECSGGTYIRTLCSDIGKELGCGGIMASLERLKASGIDIDETYNLDQIEVMSPEERQNILLPTERLFDELPTVKLVSFHEKLFRDGCAIDQRKLKVNFSIGQRLRVLDARGDFFALGELVESNGAEALKSLKIFKFLNCKK